VNGLKIVELNCGACKVVNRFQLLHYIDISCYQCGDISPRW